MIETEFRWVIAPTQAFPALLKVQQEQIKAGIDGLALYYTPLIEAWMKENAPWTDRTGNARQTLHTDFESLANEAVIWLRHGVDYGYWLEVANAGQYSIILPALDHFAPLIWEDVKKLLS